MSRTGAFIITGSGSGIGKAIAQRLIGKGHRVFGLGRDPKKLEMVARELGASMFAFSSVDLARAQDSSRATQEIRKWLKSHSYPLLGLVNNAGVVDRLPFVQSSDQIWTKQFENNLLSAVRLTRDFYPDLKESAPSSVLNISSTLGLRPIVDLTAYSAIKAAMVNWTQGLALEWAKDKIRVNCICPGIVNTPIQGFHGMASDSEAVLQAHQAQPMGVFGEPEDVAAAADFLLSEESKWTTGATLTVDGGIHL